MLDERNSENPLDLLNSPFSSTAPSKAGSHLYGQGKSDPEGQRQMASSCATWRGKGHRKFWRLSFVTCMYLVGIVVIMGFKVSDRAFRGQQVEDRSNGDGRDVLFEDIIRDGVLRHKRDAETVGYKSITKAPPVTEKVVRNCTPRSVQNFPANFLSFQNTRDGGVVLHVIIALYMFAALAIVCDDYFVPALEHICEDLGLQADVAGATFMAAGSSAPEFMTSVVGVFFAESDVGVGTIVGSAVFNILFIIGVCGVFAGMVVELTWYPLVRDSSFYLISVLTLFLIIRDKTVTWYEAVIMIFLYTIYITLMYFNRHLEKTSKSWVRKVMANCGRQPLVEKPSEAEVPDEMKRARAHSRISSSSTTLSMSKEFEKGGNGTTNANGLEPPVPEEEHETSILESNTDITPTSSQSKNGDFVSVSEYESVWTLPESFPNRILWVFLFPAKLLFFFTIPDSRRPGFWSKLYILSFICSVAWISGLTYIMVWMVTIAGDSLDIPDTVMGLTLLAAGTSVPDCMASIFVARDGYGDMAVSNSLGSNVFDILLCLGIPWLIESAIHSGESVIISSEGLTYSALTLLATVAFLLVSMAMNKFRLNKAYGLLCLIAYVFVIILSCLYELNVFGDFNPPTCPREV